METKEKARTSRANETALQNNTRKKYSRQISKQQCQVCCDVLFEGESKFCPQCQAGMRMYSACRHWLEVIV